MDVERIIDEIEQLQEMFEAPDIRPLSPSDLSAANRRHDEMLAHSPWFRLWQRYGVCCRGETEGGLRIEGYAAFTVLKPIGCGNVITDDQRPAIDLPATFVKSAKSGGLFLGS